VMPASCWHIYIYIYIYIYICDGQYTHLLLYVAVNLRRNMHVFCVVPSLKHFLMTKKDVVEDVLESSEIVEEFTEKVLLKQAAGKNFRLY